MTPLPRTSSPGPQRASYSSNNSNGSSVGPSAGPSVGPTQRASFQSVNIPTQPRSSIPQSRPPPISNHFGDPRPLTPLREASAEPEPIIVLEEDLDAEKILDERRRKREEIMAKFRANNGKSTIDASSRPGESATMGTGADSVESVGIKTGARSSTTGEFPSSFVAIAHGI